MQRFLSLLLLCVACTISVLAQGSTVHVVTLDGTINPASADYLRFEIRRASEARAECLVVRLNTPGGLLASTRSIVSDFLASPVPIIVFVYPQGSQAASAGVFVTLAAHLAVMAPGTNIGAAHPVTIGEQPDSIMMAKATNDAAAFIRTISEKRKRNMGWAEDAVRKSISITETEALRLHVIDAVASSLPELLEKVDGREVQTSLGKSVLHTRNAAVSLREKSVQQKLLDILSDPNIAYIFMMLGIYGLLFELYNPGAILPGITRDSLITLARHRGYCVRERAMLMDDLLALLATGECSEVFACGTAAIVAPISVLAEGDGVEHVPQCVDGVAAEFREALLAIQERRAPDLFGWTQDVLPL